MVYRLPDIAAKTRPPFDSIVDVRAPAEFAQDHIPGAINLPALNDCERALVGTIYTQKSRFQARRMGAAMIARNVAQHLDTVLADKNAQWTPLIYCWRGGQRSGAVATIFRQIGWQCQTLDGGYRSYRKQVKSYLYDRKLRHRFVLIDGQTGTGKTEILDLLGRDGQQVLDLERLARHRGSIFGAETMPQPSQKLFESHVAAALGRLRPDRPTFVEAESSKIGNLFLPPALWSAMCAAPNVYVASTVQARARYTIGRYHDMLERADTLFCLLDQLRSFHGHEKVDAWQDMAARADYDALAVDLIRNHYDPRYAKFRAQHSSGDRQIFELNLPDLEPASLNEAAERIAEHVCRETA